MRLERGGFRELPVDIDDEDFLDEALEAIAEDLSKIDVKAFIKALLDCCPLECIAAAAAKAEEESPGPEGPAS